MRIFCRGTREKNKKFKTKERTIPKDLSDVRPSFYFIRDQRVSFLALQYLPFLLTRDSSAKQRLDVYIFYFLFFCNSFFFSFWVSGLVACKSAHTFSCVLSLNIKVKSISRYKKTPAHHVRQCVQQQQSTYRFGQTSYRKCKYPPPSINIRLTNSLRR